MATVTNPGSFMATITHPTGNGYCRDRILRDTPTYHGKNQPIRKSFEVKILQQFYPMDENVATREGACQPDIFANPVWDVS